MPPDDLLGSLLAQLLGTYGTNNTKTQDNTGNRAFDPSYVQNILEVLGIPYEALTAAEGNFDPMAYEPTVEYSEMPESPTTPMLTAYMGGQGIEAEIAQGIHAGGSPDVVVQKVLAANGIDASQQVDDKMIADQVSRARTLAEDLFKERATYSDAMVRMPAGPEITSAELSPAARMFADAGLPLPTDQFRPEDFSGQGRVQRVDDDAMSRLVSESSEADRLLQSLLAVQQNPPERPIPLLPESMQPQQAPAPVEGPLTAGRRRVYGQEAAAESAAAGTGNLVFGQTNPQQDAAWTDVFARMSQEAAPQMQANRARSQRTERGYASPMHERAIQSAAEVMKAKQRNSYDDAFSRGSASLQTRRDGSPLRLALLRRIATLGG